MEKYLFLMRADRGAALSVLVSGSEGAAQQEAAIDALGGRMIFQWAVEGEYDVALAAEFPSPESMLAFSLLQTGAGLYCVPLRAHDSGVVDRAREGAEAYVAAMTPDGSVDADE